MLNNIASGVKEGLIGFQTAQNLRRQEDQLDREQASADANSPESQAAVKFFNDQGVTVQPGTSAKQLKDYSGFLGNKERADALSYQQQKEDRAAGYDTPGSPQSKMAFQTLLAAHPEKAAQLKQQGLDENSLSFNAVKQLMGTYDKQSGLVNKLDVQGSKNQGLINKVKATQGANPNGYASEKDFDKTVAMLNSARGDKGTAQAMNDLYSASKAKGLVSLFKDPNNMTTSDVTLLQSEIAKIATGGVPAHAEMQALSNPTLQSKLAPIITAFTNEPTPANAGAFVNHYMQYVNQLGEDARQQLSQRTGALIGTKNFSPDQLKRLQGMVGRYAPSSPQQGSGLIGQQGSSPGAPQPHPQDSQAIQWAKQNLNNPAMAQKAQAILKANGQ